MSPCDGCGTQALVETSLTTEVTGLERLGLLTAVVTPQTLVTSHRIIDLACQWKTRVRYAPLSAR